MKLCFIHFFYRGGSLERSPSANFITVSGIIDTESSTSSSSKSALSSISSSSRAESDSSFNRFWNEGNVFLWVKYGPLLCLYYIKEFKMEYNYWIVTGEVESIVKSSSSVSSSSSLKTLSHIRSFGRLTSLWDWLFLLVARVIILRLFWIGSVDSESMFYKFLTKKCYKSSQLGTNSIKLKVGNILLHAFRMCNLILQI